MVKTIKRLQAYLPWKIHERMTVNANATLNKNNRNNHLQRNVHPQTTVSIHG